MKLLMIGFLLIFFSNASLAVESADAFIIRMYTKNIKVLAPKAFDPTTNVIIENKTMVKVLGKVVKNNGELVKHLAIMPSKFQSIALKPKKNDKFYFIPMSPPFQEVELKVGKSSYEIPAKR